MQPAFTSHPASFRDPSGFIFWKDGTVYRQVNQAYRQEFELFVESGLYQNLVNRHLLLPHTATEQNLTGHDNWYQTLRPEPLDFISYPYEWCFDMWKDAALATLRLAREAMSYGMMLKDASAYNIQWHKGQMTLIDSLSFERYDESRPWIAYRQFCEHFYAPLALMHYLQEPVQPLFLGYPDGIPLSLARKMLPFRSRFHLHSYLHIHLHSAVSRKRRNDFQKKGFSGQKMQNLLRSLEEGIHSFSYKAHSGAWSGYYGEAAERPGYIEAKKAVIKRWTDRMDFRTALDAGANEGEFSLLLRDKAEVILSADADHYAINRLYRQVKENKAPVHPLLIDLSHPSPATGLNNLERSSFLNRAKTDLTLALALVHHLAIGKNIPFSRIAAMFAEQCRNLIIEFVPREDEKIQQMLQQKKDIYQDYTRQHFLDAFSAHFRISASENLGSSGRTLYLMQGHDQ